MTDLEMKRWEQLRRAMLNIVAQQHAADPQTRYTLDIRVVPKENVSKVA